MLIERLVSHAKLPMRGTSSAAGWDLYAAADGVVYAEEVTAIGTGIAVAIPEGYYGQIFGRSGLAKKGVIVLGGVIDSDYRGEITVLLSSITEDVTFHAGDRIAQLVILPLYVGGAKESVFLPTTLRGDKGFGSTGT